MKANVTALPLHAFVQYVAIMYHEFRAEPH